MMVMKKHTIPKENPESHDEPKFDSLLETEDSRRITSKRHACTACTEL